MELELFLSLLSRPESETLDFKRTHYRLSDDDSMLSFVKDVAAMANTPREASSHIILGVAKHVDGTYDLIGLQSSDHIDDADLRQHLISNVAPVPHFNYHIIYYDSKQFGVLEILPVREGPILPFVEKGKLERWAWYFRRGSRNDQVKLPADAARILAWFGIKAEETIVGVDSPIWEQIVQHLDNFNPGRHYVLITAPFEHPIEDFISNIGLMPWTSVLDFDPDSDTTGLLNSVKSVLETHRSLHRLTGGDRPILNLNSGTYWYFGRGLTGRSGVITSNEWKQWKQTQGAGLSEYIRRLAQACSPQPVTLIVYPRNNWGRLAGRAAIGYTLTQFRLTQ